MANNNYLFFGDFRDMIVGLANDRYPYIDENEAMQHFGGRVKARNYRNGFQISILRHLQDGNLLQLQDVFSDYYVPSPGPTISRDEWTICLSRFDLIKNGNENYAGYGPGVVGLGMHLQSSTMPFALCDPNSPPGATVTVFTAPALVTRRESEESYELAAFKAIGYAIIDYIRVSGRRVGVGMDVRNPSPGGSVTLPSPTDPVSDPRTWVKCSACQYVG